MARMSFCQVGNDCDLTSDNTKDCSFLQALKQVLRGAVQCTVVHIIDNYKKCCDRDERNEFNEPAINSNRFVITYSFHSNYNKQHQYKYLIQGG